MTRREACALLAQTAWPSETVNSRAEWQDRILTDPRIAAETAKRARTKARPERHGGDRTLSDQVEQAAQLLGLDGGAA